MQPTDGVQLSPIPPNVKIKKNYNFYIIFSLNWSEMWNRVSRGFLRHFPLVKISRKKIVATALQQDARGDVEAYSINIRKTLTM